MDELICKCCGGDIDPKTMTCKYCDTVYLNVKVAKLASNFNPRIAADIFTPNEMRRVIWSERDNRSPMVEKYYELGGNGSITAMQRVIEGCSIEPEYIIRDDGSIKFTGMSLVRED